jgi:hypothetical protein
MTQRYSDFTPMTILSAFPWQSDHGKPPAGSARAIPHKRCRVPRSLLYTALLSYIPDISRQRARHRRLHLTRGVLDTPLSRTPPSSLVWLGDAQDARHLTLEMNSSSLVRSPIPFIVSCQDARHLTLEMNGADDPGPLWGGEHKGGPRLGYRSKGGSSIPGHLTRGGPRLGHRDTSSPV